MREDYWTNTKTNTTLGVTGPLGSPRAWLRRAFDAVSIDDVAFQPGALTPTEISVAAVWYRPVQSLPDFGNHRALYRFFDIASPEDLQRNVRREQLYPAIGVAVAVPISEVVQWVKTARASGATYTWWKTPVNKAVRARSTKPQRRQLDHTAVYAMLDQGMTVMAIAEQLDFPRNNIHYVAAKWKKGLHLEPRRPFLNVDTIIQQRREGVPVKELARIHNSSPAYIYRLLGESDHG